MRQVVSSYLIYVYCFGTLYYFRKKKIQRCNTFLKEEKLKDLNHFGNKQNVKT